MKKLILLAALMPWMQAFAQSKQCTFTDFDGHVQECSIKAECPLDAHVHPISHHYPNPDPKSGPIPGDNMCHANRPDDGVVGKPRMPKPAVPAKK